MDGTTEADGEHHDRNHVDSEVPMQVRGGGRGAGRADWDVPTGAGGDNGIATCGIVGKSQSVLIMINPIVGLIRTRTTSCLCCLPRN
jgi:hypothetical protein